MLSAAQCAEKISVQRDLPVPLHYQVRKGIEDLIAQGHLPPGDRLPTVQELAHAFKISVPTIVRAIVDLGNAGVIVSKRGCGTFVSDITPATTQVLIGRPEPEDKGTPLRPFYAGIMEGLRKGYGQPNRRYLMAFEHSERVTARELIGVARLRRVDGVLVYQWPTENDGLLERLAAEVPLVMLQRVSAHPRIRCVLSDIKEPLRAAIRQRVERGCRSFVCVGYGFDPDTDQTSPAIQSRVFRDVLAEFGLKPRFVIVPAEPDFGPMPEETRQALQDAIRARMNEVEDGTVVFATYPSVGGWAMGDGRPFDVITYTERAATARRFRSMMTFLECRISEMAMAAAPLLKEGAGAGGERIVRVPVRLIERQDKEKEVESK